MLGNSSRRAENHQLSVGSLPLTPPGTDRLTHAGKQNPGSRWRVGFLPALGNLSSASQVHRLLARARMGRNERRISLQLIAWLAKVRGVAKSPTRLRN